MSAEQTKQLTHRQTETTAFIFEVIRNNQLFYNPNHVNWVEELRKFNSDKGLEITPIELQNEATEIANTWLEENPHLERVQRKIAKAMFCQLWPEECQSPTL